MITSLLDSDSALYDLRPHQILRPEKVIWQFPAGVEPLAQIKSKSLRKFLTKAEECLETNDISWKFTLMSAEDFAAWLPYYQAKMAENDFQVIANEAWYQEKQAANIEVWSLCFYQDTTLVASGIISCNPKTKTTQLHFKASDKLELSGSSNSSLGAIVDYFFLRWAYQENYLTITSGRSRNAFGVFNNIGHLDFKLKFGYTPHIDPTISLVSSVPFEGEKPVLFFGQKKHQLNLYSYGLAEGSWPPALSPTLGWTITYLG
jgi:hypothetical protein